MSDDAGIQMETLNQRYKELDELYHDLAVRFGLSDTALWVLYALCTAEKPYTQYDLCNAWRFPKQTVHSAIAKLEKLGYLTLHPVSGTRNRKEVSLTPAGGSFCAGTVLPLLEAEKRAYLRFSAEERETFLRLLEEQIAFLREETEEIGTQ